jgi:hypothetical protein
MLAALANPHRLRIIAALLHLQKLEEGGLVTSKLELGPDGKALNFFEVADFAVELTPAAIAAAAKSLSAPSKSDE